MITPKRVIIGALLVIAGIMSAVAISAVGDTTGTVTAAVPDQTITIPGVTNVQTYTIPTVTQTVTQTVTTTAPQPPPPPPPPPPASYPPTTLPVHHFWVGIDGTDVFNYASDSTKMDDFIVHAPESWSTQGVKFHQYQPNGKAFVYQNEGMACDTSNCALPLSTSYLATHAGATINNPWCGCSTMKVVDLGKAGAKEAIVAAIRAKANYSLWDGVFLDDVNTESRLWNKGLGIDGYTSGNDYWTRAVVPALTYVAQQLAADGKAVLPNLGGYATDADAIVRGAYQYVNHGVMAEFYGAYNNGVVQDNKSVENLYDGLTKTVAAGKTFYGIVHLPTASGAKYGFCLAAIMGGDRPDKVRIAVQQSYGSTALYWDPVFSTNLGGPITPVSHTTGTAVWSRAFVNGQNLSVNVSTQTCTIS